jgi:hypothetical protein
MALLNRKTAASQADRHFLYQESVQDVETEIDFVEKTWQGLRNRPAEFLREDFCGTANTACEWVRRDPQHHALAIDLDAEVLHWGQLNNLAKLDDDQYERINLLQENVLDVQAQLADIILAMNFSYFLFLERDELLQYFITARAGLMDDGILFLDAYGGYDAPKVLVEERECKDFIYFWEQETFNPIDSLMDCHIHFEFPDESRMDKAFSYHWRLWTLPEIRELLSAAGFSKVTVYWEGTDEEINEGNGIYEPAVIGDADPGWVCYLVAEW